MTLLFFIVYVALGWGLLQLAPIFSRLRALTSGRREVDVLRHGVLILRSLQDRLESGLIPEKPDWERVRDAVPGPWGSVFFQTLMESRDRGAPVLPSLARMQRLLEEQIKWTTSATARLAPVTGQAVLSLFLVPLFSAGLWFLLPGVDEQAFIFGSTALIAMMMGLGAFFWMSEMGESARFGQLPSRKRGWIASAIIATERLNALVMVGEPPDLAWNEVLMELQAREPELAQVWGSLVWSESAPATTGRNASEQILSRLGQEIRRLIQTSLIEGQGTLERIEALQRTWMADLRGRIEQELARLGNQGLKPLFLLVMPAIVLVMAVGMGISVQGMLQ
ncbi:MAG: hypothetical protein JST80_04075 [Bdellovibrionales bacterium]|nr:hypothetical protein [Bdellovibrionales bacterium]